jgi:hypothetical protein
MIPFEKREERRECTRECKGCVINLEVYRRYERKIQEPALRTLEKVVATTTAYPRKGCCYYYCYCVPSKRLLLLLLRTLEKVVATTTALPSKRLLLLLLRTLEKVVDPVCEIPPPEKPIMGAVGNGVADVGVADLRGTMGSNGFIYDAGYVSMGRQYAQTVWADRQEYRKGCSRYIRYKQKKVARASKTESCCAY